MANWPRAIIPFEVTSLEMPGPLISKSQSGRVNIRTTQQIGRTWTERYLVNVRSVNGRALLAFIDNVWRNGTTFTIDHRDHLTPMGTGGGSPLVNSAQLVTDPENFGLWAVGGTPVLTGGQSDPLSGTGAYLVGDDDAAASEYIEEIVTFTGDATKALAIYLKAGTATSTDIAVRDATAAVYRHRIRVTWTAGVPSPASVEGSGTILATDFITSGWYRLSFTADSVVAANSNRLRLLPASTVLASTGNVVAFGANAWNSPYAMPYRSTPGAAAQTGSLLVVDGATASVSNWLRAGDIINVAGVNGVREITADTASVAGGHVQIPINPPIFSGSSPSDNAAVTITGVTLTACILEPPTYPTTSGPSVDYGELSIKFSESL